MEAGCIGIRRVNNDDLIRVSKATGATIVVVWDECDDEE